MPSFLPSSAGVIAVRQRSGLRNCRFPIADFGDSNRAMGNRPFLSCRSYPSLMDKGSPVTGAPSGPKLALRGNGFLDEPRRPVEAGKKTPLQAGACMSGLTKAVSRPESLGLDLHEHAGRDDQAVEGIDGAGGVVVDVDHPLVGAHLELLARLLVDVGAAEDRVPLDPRGDRDRPADACVGPLGVLDDLLRRRVQRPMVVRLHPNSNPLALHSPCARLLDDPPLLTRTATDKFLSAVRP